MPDELLLVETDSPYLAPQPVRGKPNEPANVIHTARFVAELRGVAYEELERTVERERRARVRLVTASRARPASGACATFGIRPEPRARPELPDRRQHPAA